MAAWGLVASLVLGTVACVLSLVGYLVDLPMWLVGVCLGAAALGGSPPPSSRPGRPGSSTGPQGASSGSR